MKSPEEQPKNILALTIQNTAGEFFFAPTDKRNKELYRPERQEKKLNLGELVYIEVIKTPKYKKKGVARILSRLPKDKNKTLKLSEIAIQEYNIPSNFSKKALKETKNLKIPPLSEGREDLRAIPLVTIDGEDAKDFDDAVWAMRDIKNPELYHLIVAIADVSYYVKNDSELDREAKERGNSVYFIDQVIPMLPEALSNDLCSLRPNEDRASLAVHLFIDSQGELKKYHFTRALIRSHARLTYHDAQAIFEGKKKSKFQKEIKALFDAYQILQKARLARKTLELDLPEYQIKLDDHYNVTSIEKKKRLDAHKLIEEFMITANRAAADYIQTQQNSSAGSLFRSHDEPSFEKMEKLTQTLKNYGYALPKIKNDKASFYQQILDEAEARQDKDLIHEAVLRAQAQASYTIENNGHFGLALEDYTHFTSPIRRYADLCVHRKIISMIESQKKPQKKPPHFYTEEELLEIAIHISEKERIAAKAERDTQDRYLADYMQTQKNKILEARITHLANFGMFVTLLDSGADALIPFKMIKGDYFQLLEEQQKAVGERTGKTYALGDKLKVKIIDANPVNSAIIATPIPDKKDQKKSKYKKATKTKKTQKYDRKK